MTFDSAQAAYDSAYPDHLDEHDPTCTLDADHEGACLDGDDVAELRLMARDYDAWAAL
jgi:hypothetical protein